MSDRLLKESDVLKIAFQLPYVVTSEFAKAVRALPSADRRQGVWKDYRVYDIQLFDCSICGYHARKMSNYCPNCGARMKTL